MKLRLPHKLQAALIATLASVSLTTLSTGTLTVAAGAALLAGQTYGRELTQVTTEAGGVTYNGYVFNMLLDNTNAFASRNFYQSTYDEASETWSNIDPKYTSSNTPITTPFGNGAFWTMYCSTANVSNSLNYYGTTLRLTGSTSSTAEANRKLTTNFSDFTIGGLIADDAWGNTTYTHPAYWFYRAGSMDINGYNDVNMDINSYVRFSYGGSVNMKKGGTWNIHSGKTLEFDNNSSNTATTFKFYENQALTVTGGGTLYLGRSSNGTYSVEMQAGSSLHITGNSTVNLNASAGTFTVNGTITVDSGSTLTTSRPTTLGRTITNNGQITFAGNKVTLTGDLSGFDMGGVFEDYTGGTANGFAGDVEYTVIKGGGSSNLTQVSYNSQDYALANGKFTVEGATDYTTYYLNADSTSMDLSAAITYAAEHGSGATLSKVEVKGAGETITVGSNQSLANLNVAAGASVSTAGAGTLTLGALTNAGTLNIGSGVTMGAVALTTSDAPALHVTNGGVLSIKTTGTTVDGDSIVNGESGEATGNKPAFSKLFKGEAVAVTGDGKLVLDGNVCFNGNSGTFNMGLSNLEITGFVNMNSATGGATYNIGGNNMKVDGYYWLTNNQNLTVAGGTLEVGGTLKLGHAENGTGGNYKASLNASAGSTVKLHDVQFNGGRNVLSVDGSSLTFTSTGTLLSQANNVPTAPADLNAVTLNNATLVAVDNSWSLAPIASATVTVSGTTTVNAASGKQISLAANSINGKFVFAAGSTGTLLLESANGVLTEGLVLNGATVGFAGTWDLTALDDGSTKPTYTGGAESGNGFAALATTVTLADLSGGGSITAASENATFKINEITGTLDHTTGIVSTSGDPDYSVFHVMSKSENVTQGRKDSHDPIYSLADGATLVVDAALDGSKLTRESGSTGNATLNIQGGSTYTSDGNAKNITITGAGTYALTKTTASGSWNTVPMIDALDATNWTGTVLIENVQKFGPINLNNYGTSHSRVKLSGVTGWMPNDTTHNPLLEIGDGGLKLIDGGSNKYTEFAGGVAGGGTLDYAITSPADNMTFKFTGGVADWTGAFKVSVGKTAKLEFSGSATNVNAAIQRTAGTLNMQVGDGSTAFSTTFSKDVTASSLTVKANAAATFGGTTVIDNGLTLESGATVTNGGALTLGGTIVFGGSAIVNNGTVAFGSNVVFNMESLTPEDGVYTLFSGTGTPVDLSGFSTADIIVAGGTAGKKWTFGDNGTISYTLGAEKVWTGGVSYYWNYEDANWDGERFAENDTAVFNVDWDMVQVNTAVKATTIQVTGGGMLMLSATEGSLSASSVIVEGSGTNFAVSTEITGVEEFNVGEGAVWALSNNQTLGRGTNNGTISLYTGYTLTLTDGSTAAALMQSVEGGGNLKLTADTFFAGSSTDSGVPTTRATGTLIVDGATLSIGSMETGPYQDTYVNMSSFQHVQLDNGTLYIHNNVFDLNGLTVNSGKTGTVRIYDSKAYDYNTLNLKGTTQVDGTLIFNGAWKHSFTIDAMAGSGEVKFQGIDKDEGFPKMQTANLAGGTIGKLTISGKNAATAIVNINGDLTVDSSATIDKGVMNVSGSLTVNSNALDLSGGGSATGTLNIKGGGTVTLKKATNSSLWLDDGAHLNLEAGGTLDLQKYDVIIAGRANDASIVATTNNQQYGTGNTNITVTNADVTAQANITLANKLVNSTVDAGTHTVTLTNAQNVLAGATVGVGGTLNINAAAELKSAIDNSGTVAFNSNVTATGLELHANQAVLLDMNGAYTLDTSGNYFAGATADYIVLVEGGGTVNPGDHTLTMSDTAYAIQSSGLAVANVSWGSGWIKNCQYYQNEGSAKVTEIYANAQALDATCNRIRVTNASLEVDDEAYNLEVDNAHITVTGTNGTIDMLAPLGGTSTIELQTGMTLNLPEISFAENDAETTLRLKHADATDYAVTDNSNLANAMVRITSREDDAERNGRVTITAAAGTSGVYRVNSEGFGVNATKLEKIADSRVQVNNTLNVKEIHNDAAGKTGDFVLTQGVDAAALDTVIATSGNIEFQNMSETEQANLNTLNIGEGRTVSMYTGSVADAAHEASVTVTGTLTAGRGATLNANLEMASGSTLDVSASNGVNGLLMGSSVTLNQGMNLADYTGEWSTWVDGTKYALFTGVDGLDIGSGTGTAAIDYTQWVDASNYFTNITEQNRYFLCYDGAPTANAEAVLTAVGNNGSNVGMVYIMVMPEPTTSTLSLLALCALAARRRRK